MDGTQVLVVIVAVIFGFLLCAGCGWGAMRMVVHAERGEAHERRMQPFWSAPGGWWVRSQPSIVTIELPKESEIAA
jgi:hypothetical protein